MMLSLQPLAPHLLPGLCFETTRNSAIRNDKKIVAHRNRRRHIGRSACGAPLDMRARHVSAPIWINRDNVELRKSAGDKQEISAAIINGRRDELFRWTIHNPMAGASVGIVAS